ncbi:DUF459 domain-containing protein [Campylobacter sp. RM16192]|uniref:DUF459 domain-containing protein n=1 Tax=Campylobacter sp. RM16192 TaxID=1660080 RepID=UPI001451D888|nr:DUF459 domain-containing protein [Campylobacter sp. RM16192]QCD51895.1 SGNH family hydrolase [Campylobacter sp. RM16192]
MRSFAVIFIAFFIVFMVLLNPFSIYFETKYQKDFFLSNTKIDKFSIFIINFINKQFDNINFIKEKTYSPISRIQTNLEENLTQRKSTISEKNDQNLTTISKDANKTQISEKNKTILQKKPIQQKKVSLESNSTIILVGDSIMRGFGWGFENLLKNRQIKVKNLGKASTGLINKKFYDWQNELDKILEEYKNENTILIAAFGANDTYSSAFDKKIEQFGTEDWINGYKNRVEEIYQVAQKYNTDIVWIGLPCMKNQKYSDKIQNLNQIFKSIADEKGVQFISLTDAICKNGKFIKIDNNKKVLRDEDGIHLSMHGSIQAAKFVIIEILK